MSKLKLLIVGPTKSGKSTLANILGDLQDGPSTVYRPTVGCRIVDFERDPPPGVTNFGKVHVELWDVSGDFKYEKCWAPIKKDAHGVIFVVDPADAGAENVLNRLVSMFPKEMNLPPKFCMVFINHHNVGGSGEFPNYQMPQCMKGLTKHEGSCEDS